MIRFIAALLCLCVVAAHASAVDFDAPSSRNFEVSDYRDEQGRRWIHMTAVFECLYRDRIDDIIATLWDFPSSPKVFSRIEAVRVRSDTGSEAVTEQRTAVRILGLAFVSNLVFKNGIIRKGPKEVDVTFEMIETDGSCLATKGAWSLEDKAYASDPVTYATYSIDTYIEPRFLGEAAIIRAFGAADIKKIMRDLGTATAKRSAKR